MLLMSCLEIWESGEMSRLDLRAAMASCSGMPPVLTGVGNCSMRGCADAWVCALTVAVKEDTARDAANKRVQMCFINEFADYLHKFTINSR